MKELRIVVKLDLTLFLVQTLATEKNPARAPYATELKAERLTIKTNRDTNQVIRDAIKIKLAQVKTLIAQYKANKTLKTKKAALTIIRDVKKADRATLKGINTTLTN